MKLFLLAAAGGALGAAGRYGVGLLALRWLGAGFPWGTLIVNVLGSFLMGVIIEIMADKIAASMEMRVFLTTGILGGFTTFSAFSLDVAQLLARKEQGLAALYIGGTLSLGLLALFAGMVVVRGSWT